MKKILCDKDGKFLSVHEKNETFVELKDGDYLTHEDGCILIYKEYECKENISEISYHVYLRNNKLHFPQTEMSFSYYDFIPSYRFSAEEEKKRKRACRKRIVLQYKEQMYRKNSVACQEGLHVLLH